MPWYKYYPCAATVWYDMDDQFIVYTSNFLN